MNLDALGLACALLAAVVTGFSKAGVPGTGILVVPLMAQAFGGHLAVGATVPLLLVGDCVAVYFYRADCEWSRLRQIAPTVVAGLLVGVAFLRFLPTRVGPGDPMNRIIGALVLMMLAFQLLRDRFQDRLLPTSPVGTALTGLSAGFSTMVSNAAGPIMSIYLTATGLPKNRFMGTAAWYFLIFNTMKLPFLYWLSMEDPSHPFLSVSVLKGEAFLIPAVFVGAALGRMLLPRLHDKSFTRIVLFLAGAAAVKLLLS